MNPKSGHASGLHFVIPVGERYKPKYVAPVVPTPRSSTVELMRELENGPVANVDVVARLLDQGAEVNWSFDEYSVVQSPFSRACLVKAPLEIVKVMHARGANVHFPVFFKWLRAYQRESVHAVSVCMYVCVFARV
jgi:hypothetical protein